jgi:hypothetical protein
MGFEEPAHSVDTDWNNWLCKSSICWRGCADRVGHRFRKIGFVPLRNIGGLNTLA